MSATSHDVEIMRDAPISTWSATAPIFSWATRVSRGSSSRWITTIFA